MDSIKTKIENSIKQINAGKVDISNAIRFCNISAYPDTNNPDKYETFESYCNKIKTIQAE